MARKFLQMGYTRAMRYAKHKGGRKYDSNHELLPESVNEEKIECAQVSCNELFCAELVLLLKALQKMVSIADYTGCT